MIGQNDLGEVLQTISMFGIILEVCAAMNMDATCRCGCQKWQSLSSWMMMSLCLRWKAREREREREIKDRDKNRVLESQSFNGKYEELIGARVVSFVHHAVI